MAITRRRTRREERMEEVYRLWAEMGYTEAHRKASMKKWLGVDRLDHPHAPLEQYVRYLRHKRNFRKVLGRDNSSISDEMLERMCDAEARNPIADSDGVLRRLSLLYEERGWRMWRYRRLGLPAWPPWEKKAPEGKHSPALGEIDWGI